MPSRWFYVWRRFYGKRRRRYRRWRTYRGNFGPASRIKRRRLLSSLQKYTPKKRKGPTGRTPSKSIKRKLFQNRKNKRARQVLDTALDDLWDNLAVDKKYKDAIRHGTELAFDANPVTAPVALPISAADWAVNDIYPILQHQFH